MSSGPILYPNVTSLPGQSGIGSAERPSRKQDGVKGEFDQVFDKELLKSTQDKGTQDLSQARTPLKFSAHAMQRLKDRKIELSPALMGKVNEAIDKADAKGLSDALVLTNEAAMIVSVKNRTVVTAMDRNALSGNVFTNIDGAVIV